MATGRRSRRCDLVIASIIESRIPSCAWGYVGPQHTIFLAAKFDRISDFRRDLHCFDTIEAPASVRNF